MYQFQIASGIAQVTFVVNIISYFFIVALRWQTAVLGLPASLYLLSRRMDVPLPKVLSFRLTELRSYAHSRVKNCTKGIPCTDWFQLGLLNQSLGSMELSMISLHQ